MAWGGGTSDLYSLSCSFSLLEAAITHRKENVLLPALQIVTAWEGRDLSIGLSVVRKVQTPPPPHGSDPTALPVIAF